MADFIQLVFYGIAQGCVYALLAMGFTIIFKSSGVINFAQGELLLAGGLIASVGALEWHLNFFLAALIAIACTAAIGVLFERLALRRMIGRPVFSIIMITIGLDVLLLKGVEVADKSDTRSPAEPNGITGYIPFQGVRFSYYSIWAIVVTLLICAVLYLFFRYTRYGLAMRATALDQEAALALGINIRLVYALAWGIASALAVIAGIFLAISAFTFNFGLSAISLIAFPAIILGGLDSIPGAVVGGVIIGLIQELTLGYESHFTKFVGTGFDGIAPFLIMVIVLLVRPYGLFGTRKVERV